MNNNELTVQCCVCRRVRDSKGEYHQPPAILGDRVSHTYCPECARFMLTQIALFKDNFAKAEAVRVRSAG
ncbi:MAG: hypothetical protein JXR97_08145 [Planctomycetes bacterium]|nr:hypothetical protein [Planctomycetota bacterium]